MRFSQLEERVMFWLTLVGRKKGGGINENCLNLQGFIMCNTNKEKAGSPGKALITLHVVEGCLGGLERARNRIVSQTF